MYRDTSSVDCAPQELTHACSIAIYSNCNKIIVIKIVKRVIIVIVTIIMVIK